MSMHRRKEHIIDQTALKLCCSTRSVAPWFAARGQIAFVPSSSSAFLEHWITPRFDSRQPRCITRDQSLAFNRLYKILDSTNTFEPHLTIATREMSALATLRVSISWCIIVVQSEALA